LESSETLEPLERLKFVLENRIREGSGK